jgi:hypothetical protein
VAVSEEKVGLRLIPLSTLAEFEQIWDIRLQKGLEKPLSKKRNSF